MPSRTDPVRTARRRGPAALLAHLSLHCGPLAELRFRHASRRSRRRLAAAREPVAELGAEIERRFLACGAALHRQVELTGRLTQQSAALENLAATRERAESAVRAALTADLDLADSVGAEVSRLADTLEQHAADLQRLLAGQQQLERSFAPMRPLQSLFRIESVLLPADLQAQFHAVIAEMQRLHGDVSLSFGTNGEALERTRAETCRAAGQLREGAAAVRSVSEEKRHEVDLVLGRLRRELQLARERHRQLATAIADLNRATDAMTVSLQYQDITRQKIAHVDEAAVQLLTPGPRARGRRFADHARVQAVLCEVQMAQLTAAQDELRLAAEAISGGLERLLDRLQWIERECLSADRLAGIAGGLDAAVAETARIHQVTREITRGALGSLGTAVETAQGLTHATVTATNTMRQLAADLHLMGLNAQVQAVRANNGSLEVLSRAVATMSAEAGQLTAAFESDLEKTTVSVRSFIDRSEQQHRTTGAEVAASQTRHDAALHELEEQHTAGNAVLSEVQSILRQLRELADELPVSANLADFSMAPLDAMRSSFAELAGRLAVAASGAAPVDAATLNEAQTRYTMESEREAHSAVVGGGADALEPAVTVRAADSEPAGTAPVNAGVSLGDNIELF